MLREMYFGKVIPWERKNRKCEEQAELVKKIEDEERYFIQKMSLDDCERFQKLSNLYSQLAMSEEGEIFSYGFTMGAMLMMDIDGRSGVYENRIMPTRETGPRAAPFCCMEMGPKIAPCRALYAVLGVHGKNPYHPSKRRKGADRKLVITRFPACQNVVNRNT